MKNLILFLLLMVTLTTYSQSSTPIRVIMIGAHPDDCDQDGGGTAILLAKRGYAVKFVSVTNGDAGHQTMKGLALAKRSARSTRTQEKPGVPLLPGWLSAAQSFPAGFFHRHNRGLPPEDTCYG